MNKGYSICFNEWALDKEIKNELGLLLIISSLCAEKGYCFASNQYLAKIFQITEISISSKIGKLEKKGYIIIEYQKRGCEIISRKIRLKNILIDDLNFFKSTIKENFKDNNINIKNTNNKYNIYGEFKNVKLKDDEYQKLKDKGLLSYIESLSCYLEQHPKKRYASHYATILVWSKKDNKKETTFTIQTPNWFNETCSNEQISLAEKNELENILNEIGE